MSFEKLFDSLGDLPVARIAHEVAASVKAGIVGTLASATGSGKTLYQTAKLADMLDEQVLVLVPRRFLAVNAAETVAELSGYEIGNEVGYAVGSQTGDRSCWSRENTKLVFATYGYALASGLVNTAKNFVLDEVHETSMDLSIIRALLYRRMQNGESIRLLEMSATMDTKLQSGYWNLVAKTEVFEIEGKTFSCDVRHMPAGSVEQEVMSLIAEGRRGILVFRPGVGEVKETAEKISDLVSAAGLNVDVSEIYGEMPYEDRRKATAPTDKDVKVLVGTNVVESGANITWLDAGVSCGTGKENSVRPATGATYLELIDLPRWRLEQQEGRVKRFRDGVFVLCSPKSFTERERSTRPEIERLALTELVLHCASFGLRSDELTFDYAPNPEKVRSAEEKLQRLGLINEACALTEAGAWIAGLPVGPETGAMLWHASRIGCLPSMLPLAAVIEVGGLRKEFRFTHLKSDSSDYLDGLLAFSEAYEARGKERRKVLEQNNVGYKRFEAASELLRDLSRRIDVPFDFDVEENLSKLRQCIVAGSLDKLFVCIGYRSEVASVKSRYTTYRIGQGSVVPYVSNNQILAGDLRVITPKDRMKTPFTILEKVTLVSLEDLREVAKIRPEILTEETHPGERFLGSGNDYQYLKLFGLYTIQQAVVHVLEPDAESDWLRRYASADPYER